MSCLIHSKYIWHVVAVGVSERKELARLASVHFPIRTKSSKSWEFLS